MKHHIVYLLAVITLPAFSQNKTLGVGTATSNPNAALHVESPTNNQGFIMPRLSTVQRNAISLAGADKGLMLYDTDINKPYYWDGSSWQPAAGLAFPFFASDNNASASFSITNTDAGFASTFINTGTGGAAQFAIPNAASTAIPLHVLNAGNGYGFYSQNSGSNSAIAAFNSNTSNANATIVASHAGLGNVANFTSNNPANATPTLFAQSNGTGSVASIFVNNGSNTAPAIDINHLGTGNAITANRPIQASAFIGDGSALTNLPPLAASSVTNAEISDGTIGSEDLSSSINITTSGNISAGSFIGNGSGLTGLPVTGWGLGGNTGTDPATNFIGTTDAQNFIIKSNNVEGIRVMPSGQVGVNSTPAAAQFAVGATATQTIGIHAGISTPSAVQNKAMSGYAAGSTAQNIGIYGTGEIDGSNGAIGVYGEAIGSGTSDAFGLYGVTNNFTSTSGTTYGLFASAVNGATNWAGFFDQGNVHVTNGLSVGSPGTFGTNGQVLVSQGPGVAPIWSNASVGANSVTNTEISDGTIGSEDLSPLINISTSGNIGAGNINASGTVTATSFSGDGSALTNLPSSGWGLSGNSGTIPGTNFIGTIDNTDFSIRTNSTERIQVNKGGYVGINTVPDGFSQLDARTSTTEAAISGMGSNSSGLSYGLKGSAIGTAATNYGIWASAENGTTNWAGYFKQGNVAIEGGIALGIGNNFGTSGQLLTSQGPGVAPIWTASPITVNAGSESVYAGAGVGTGPEGVFIGNQAGATNVSAAGNTFIGRRAGTVNAAGTSNTFLGWNAGAVNSSGNSNVMIGAGAGTGVTSGVSQTFGNNNILIGTHADIGTDGLNNAVAIGFGAVVNVNDAMVLGDVSNMKVGIGTSNPVSRLHVLDATTVSSSVQITKTGTGDAMSLNVTGSSGRGNVISITSAANPNVALETSTAGFGMAGLFQTTNGSNSSPVVQAISNGSGPTLQLNPSGGGIAVDMLAGTLRYYVLTVNTPGSIPTRAGVYEITNSGGSYTLPTFALSGETCLVYNNTGVSVTVESIGIASQTVRQYVKIGSAWKIVN